MKKEEVFKFVNVRPVLQSPAQKVEQYFVAYDKQNLQKSPLHTQILTLKGENARTAADELAKTKLLQNKDIQTKVQTVLTAVKKASEAPTVDQAKKILQANLGQELSNYLKLYLKPIKDLVWDILYSHALLPSLMPEQRAMVYDSARAIHFLELLSVQALSEKPLSYPELSKVRPTIPNDLFIQNAVNNTAETARAANAAVELDKVYKDLMEINQAIVDIKKGQQLILAKDSANTLEFSNQNNTGKITISPKLKDLKLEVTEGVQPILLDGTHDVQQDQLVIHKKLPWLFESNNEKPIMKKTQEFIAKRKHMEGLEVQEVLTNLEQEKYDLVTNYVSKLPQETLKYVLNNEKFSTLVKDVAVPNYSLTAGSATPPPGRPLGPEPEIKPLGIGDLLIVKQELQYYAAGEVAHIENVMKSEFKNRTHTRMNETEETIITETEQIEENEKDLQTTERFELQKEAQKTIENKMSLEAGLSVTAGYGPVSVTANADFAISETTSESNKNASNFAKEVTEKSISKIMNKAREERTRRTLQRIEEKNEHGFDNKTGKDHIIGVYRWVDKYYKAKLINYGRRMMIECIIPEPAAFYLALQTQHATSTHGLMKPKEPLVSGRQLKPSDLTRYNYTTFVSQYNVEDVEPYPADVVRVSAAFAETVSNEEKNKSYGKTSEKLVIPKGYTCSSIYGRFNWFGYEGKYFECFVAGGKFPSTSGSGIEGVIPISIMAWVTSFHVNLVATCTLKTETKEAWQLKTYHAIMSAFERALAEYNQQLAALQIQSGVNIQGRNPEHNRKIEKDELKKGAMRQLTNNFSKTKVQGKMLFNEKFDAMKANGDYGYPEFDVNESIMEGKIQQFFEQAFEWKNMTYWFYPYFWGRKSEWKNIFPLNDTDPQFTDFIRAGSARIIIPVHPAYNETVLHYLATKEIWNGGTPPTLNDPLFISIVEELKASSNTDIDGALNACSLDSGYPCVVDEWEIKLPTSLVYLQETSKLPDFRTQP
ncbi:hypothetical protein [Neobacillus kokaensis]|uniref:Uncharacterized protein n=1 Tax=Neobacillus kokaensis TaxID=2759023 RepID=A0ABQ3N8C2_9BACI|nr:hypothetical protein [Neobacillus kokaensis]GHI00983.1 hypothetical protein AM1BK_45250 [Neobacillus kokaensis]